MTHLFCRYDSCSCTYKYGLFCPQQWHQIYSPVIISLLEVHSTKHQLLVCPSTPLYVSSHRDWPLFLIDLFKLLSPKQTLGFAFDLTSGPENSRVRVVEFSYFSLTSQQQIFTHDNNCQDHSWRDQLRKYLLILNWIPIIQNQQCISQQVSSSVE